MLILYKDDRATSEHRFPVQCIGTDYPVACFIVALLTFQSQRCLDYRIWQEPTFKLITQSSRLTRNSFYRAMH